MNKNALRVHLLAEVRDLLGAGAVGLYEFIYVLRSEQDQFLGTGDASLTLDEMQELALEALQQLLAEGTFRLEWHFWNDANHAEKAAEVLPADEDWQTPTTDRFLALVPA